jgi:hypothetical protein
VIATIIHFYTLKLCPKCVSYKEKVGTECISRETGMYVYDLYRTLTCLLSIPSLIIAIKSKAKYWLQSTHFCFLEWCVRPTTSSSFESRLSRQCGILNISVCYWKSFTFLYEHVDGVSASLRKHLWASTVCYIDSFTSYIYMTFVPQSKHARASTANMHGSPRSVKEITLLFICRLCSYLTENTFRGLNSLLQG